MFNGKCLFFNFTIFGVFGYYFYCKIKNLENKIKDNNELAYINICKINNDINIVLNMIKNKNFDNTLFISNSFEDFELLS
jgi:hypothetical protein